MGAASSGYTVECCTSRDRDIVSARSRTTNGDINSARIISPSPRVAPAKEDRLGHKGRLPQAVLGAIPTATRSVLGDISNVQELFIISEKTEKLPSRGSVQHATGECKRCCFFPRGRCTNGYDCEFCHHEHEKRSHRKRKGKRSSQTGIDIEGDEESEDVAGDVALNGRDKFKGLEIQLPSSPDSPYGDTTCTGAFTSWSQTPEAPSPSIYVQSCLCTVPAVTQQNTSAVPMYTPTPTCWGLDHKALPVRASAESGEYYQIQPVGDWTLHPPTGPCENRFLADAGSIFLPETAPLSLHQWQDAGPSHWRDTGCSWPMSEAGWECSSASQQQSWEWSMHADESYLACWSAPQTDSQMPEYMPAIQCLPAWVKMEDMGTQMSEDIGTQTSPVKQALPPGVQVAVDMEPPPLAPASP